MDMNTKVPMLGEKKIDIDGFTFGERSLQMNLARLVILFICSDPTEKQEKLLKKLEVVLLDDFGNQYYPREKKDEDTSNGQNNKGI